MVKWKPYRAGLERIYGSRTCQTCGKEVFCRDTCTECQRALHDYEDQKESVASLMDRIYPVQSGGGRSGRAD